MNNFSLAQDATAMAMDSQGSSMREQTKYAESLEGRLNRLDTAWNKVILSAGSAVVTDGFIATVETLNDFATATSSIIGKIGVLSGVFGTLGGVIFLLSTRFRTFTTSLIFGTQGMTRAQLATAGLTAGMTRLGIATTGAKVALRGLLAATGVGAAFVVIGFAIEKLISAYSKAKQAQEDFEQSLDKNIEALTSNKHQTEELITTYSRLSEQRKSEAWNSENEKEYLKIQSQLAEAFPALISYIDSTGQAHLKTSEQIEKEIKLTKELIEAKKEEVKINAQDTFNDESKEQDKIKKEIDRLKKQKENLEEFKSKNTPRDNGVDKLIRQIETEIVQSEIKISNSAQKITGEVLKVADAYNELEIDPTIKSSLENFVYSLDFSKLDDQALESFSVKIAKVSDELQKAYESGNSSEFSRAIKEFEEYTKQMGTTDLKAGGLSLNLEKVKEVAERLANATYVGADGMMDYAEGMDEASESANKLLDSYNNAISNIESLNGFINELNESHQLSAKSISTMMEKYPDLLSYLGDESKLRAEVSKMIEQEKNVALDAITQKLSGNEEYFKKVVNGNKVLVDTLAKTYNVDLNNVKTLAQFKLAVEQGLMKQLANGWASYYDAQAMAFTAAGRKMLETMSYAEAVNSPELKAISQYEQAMKSLTGNLRSITSSMGYSDINTTGLADSTSKLGKEYQNSTYVSDKFRQSLEKLNLELEKQRAIQAKFPKHSKEYQNSLKSELSLLTQKKKLLEDQAKSMQSQINSGKIKETGLITTKSSAPTSSANVAQWYLDTYRMSGNFGKKDSLHPDGHWGSDMNVKGTTGNQDLGSTIRALVGGTVKQIFKNNKTAGNGIVIQGADGREYRYIHLQNAPSYKVGQSVSAGQEIGKMGSTGKSTAAHLDLKIKDSNGKYVDPEAFIRNLASGVSSIDVSKSTAEGLQSIDQAKSDLLQLQSDALDVQQQIDQLHYAIVESGMAYYENLIAGVDRSIQKSQAYAKQQDSASQAHRDQLKEEIRHNLYKQKLLHQEANYIREQLKSDKLSAAVKAELTVRVSELSLAWWDVEEAINSIEQAVVDSKLNEYADLIEEINTSISRSEKLMDMYTKGTAEYNRELENVIKNLKKQQELHIQEANYIREQLKNERLSIEQKKELERQLSSLSLAWWDLESRIMSYNQSIADEAINAMKRAYEKQRDYAIALKDEQIKNAEEAHKRKIELLDEELDAYENAINEQLKLMNRQRDEDGFNKEIGKLQKEELDLVSQINILSLDDSRETQLKKKELEEQLANIREQITEKQQDREFNLREQNLQDELDAYKEEIEAKKKTEEEKYQIIKEQLERERKEIERHYDQLINNEQFYSDMRQQIVNGNVDNMLGKLKEFLDMFKSMNKETVEELGMSWQELQNIINNIIALQGQLGNVTVPNIGGGSPNNSSKQSDWQTYLSNKKAWDNAEPSRQQKLNEENNKYRLKWGFPDGSYDQLKDLDMYHVGGIVGSKTNRLTELANKLFNAKPNEQVIKSLHGELQIPPKNIPNIFNNMKTIMSNGNSGQGNIIQIDKLISIDRIEKDANINIDRLVDQATDRLINRMKPYGFRLT